MSLPNPHPTTSRPGRASSTKDRAVSLTEGLSYATAGNLRTVRNFLARDIETLGACIEEMFERIGRLSREMERLSDSVCLLGKINRSRMYTCRNKIK